MTRTIAFTLVCALTCFVGAFASGIVESKFTTQTPPGDECAHVNCTNECSTEAIYTRLENCSQVCECINGKVNLVTCNGELQFNLVTSQCDFPENVQCEIPSDPNSECDESEKSCPAVDGKDPTYLPLPDCTKFCECSNGKPHLFDCPDGLHFNPVLNVCDWPENAGCENGTVTSVPPVTSEPETTTEVLTDGPDTLEPVTSTPIPPEDDPNAECEESEKQCPAVDGKDPTYLPLPDCTKFCECSNGNPHLFTCPDGLHFNPVLNVCDWPQDAGCENGSVTTLSPTPEEPETTTAVPTDEPDNPEPTTSNPIPPEDDPNAECEESEKQCPAVDGKDPTYLPLPDCTKFCECSNGNPHLFTCPDGLHFNPVLNVCDWPQDAGCENGSVTTLSPTPEEPETTTAVPTDEPDTPEPTTSNPIPPEDDPNAECEESEKQCPAVDGKDPTYLPLPDCTKFCECSNGNPHLFTCPDGLHFNPVLNVCDWPQDAGCANGTVTTVKPTTAEPITVKPTTAEPIPVKPTTEDPNAECQESVKQCPAVDGKDPTYLPLPDCTKFCECSNGNPHLFTCPDGLHFNPVLNVCDWPQNAGCENGPATTLKPTTAEPVTVKPTTAEPTPVKPTTEDPNAECQESVKQCPAVDGKDPTYLPLPDCTKFCECSNGNPHLFTCPDGLHFNPVLNVCDWPQDAGCENGPATTLKPTTAAPVTVKPTTAEPTPVKPTTEDPNAECQESVKQCPAVDGKDPTYLPLPDCTKFCECSNGNPHLFTCPDGLHFNPVLNVCDWPQNAGCENGPATTLKPTTAAPVTVKPTTAEPTPVKPTTEDPNAECQESVKQCPAVDGKDPTYLPLPDCTKFCECSNGNPHLFTCPDGLHFNPVLNVCDWPQDAGCENGPATTLKPTTAAPVTVKPTTAEPTPVRPTTEDPNAECQESVKQCPAVDGKDPTYLPLPDCTKFCECSNGNPHLFTCPDGLHFNPVLNVCDWPQNAGCENGPATTLKPTTAAPVTVKPTTAEPTPVKPTTEDPNAECQESVKQCPAVDGKDPTYLPLPDCTKFCECSNGNPHLFTCPDGLHFNPVLNVCDWPQDAGCENGPATTLKPTTAAPVTVKPTTAEPTPVKPTTEDPNAECQESVKQCPAVDGKDPTYLPLPDCTKFCECSNGNPHLFTCPDGLHFNPVLNVCDWPQDAGCANGTVTTAKPTTAAPITAKPTTAEPTPVKPTTEDPNAECQESVKQCPAVDGKDPTYLPLPDCTKFCECSNGNPHLFTCPDGLHFNPVLNVCDWPQDAGCANGTVTTAKPTTVAPPTIKPTTAKPTTAAPTTTTVDPNAECQESVKQCPAVDGKDPTYLPLPDCTKFCECSNGNPHLFTCPDGLHFNPVLNVCDWPQNAGCENGPATTLKPTTAAPITAKPTTAEPTPVKPTTEDPNAECQESVKQCPAVDGKDPTYLPLPDCTKFCECSNGNPHLFTCPDGLHFNPVLNVCDWPQDAGCANGTVTTAKPTTVAPITVKPTTAEPTPVKPTTEDPNAECQESVKQCPAVDGKDPTYLPLPDCTKFCECSNGNPHLFTCPDGLHFNPVLNVCDWPQDAGCENGPATTLKPTTAAPVTVKPTTAEPTPVKPTTVDPNAECQESVKQCPAVDGKDPTYLPLPDCTKFCECSNGNPHLFTCPDGLHFNPVLNVCDWPQDAGCENGPATTLKPTTAAPVTVKPTTAEPTPVKPTTEDPNAECQESVKQCPAVDGKDPTYLPLPDCTKFCECSNGNPHLFTCPDGLHFNPVLNVCDWPQDAGCANGTVTTAKPTTAAPITVKPTTAEPTPVKPTTEDPNAECQESVKQCPAVDGKDPTYLPLPDCTKFCECSNGNPHLFTCPDGLHFNPVLNVCDWPQDAGCANGTVTTLKPTTAAPVTVKPTTAEPTPVKPTTEDPNAECQESVKQCPAVDGKDPTYLPLPDCTKFCECSNGNPHLFTCPDGLHFNPVLNVCDWPQDAGCENGTVTTAKPTTVAPPTVKPTTAKPTTAKPTTTVDPNAECQESVKQCPAVDGKDPTYLPLPDCTKFCECSNGKPYLFDCPEGLHFNPVLNVCDWPQDAGCENGPATTLKPTTAKPTTAKPTTAKPTTAKPTTAKPTTAKPTTTTVDPNAECQESVKQCPAVDGKDPTYLPLPDCTKFCECSNGKPYLFDCPEGLHFNPVLNVCDWPQDAGCENGPATTLKPTTAKPTTAKPTTVKPTTAKPTTAKPTTAKPTTTTVDPNAECQQSVKQCPAVDGKDPTYLPLPDCTKFCECSNGKPYLLDCPAGLHFNPVLNVCDWPQDAGCENGPATTLKPTTAKPTTAKPTTAKPTTAKPTTAKPTTAKPTTAKPTTAKPTTVAPNDPNAVCLSSSKTCPAVDGAQPTYLPLPDCTKFCECSNGTPYAFDCPAGLHFNPVLNVCDWPQDAGCTGL